VSRTTSVDRPYIPGAPARNFEIGSRSADDPLGNRVVALPLPVVGRLTQFQQGVGFLLLLALHVNEVLRAPDPSVQATTISPQPSVSMSLIFAKMFSTRRHFTIAARVKVLAARDKRRCLRAPAPLAVMANFILADDFKRERLGKQAPSQSLPQTVNPADCRSRARPQVSSFRED